MADTGLVERGVAVLPPIGEYPNYQFLEKLLANGCKFCGIYLAVMRILCYIIFTGKFDDIDFKMKITYLVASNQPLQS